MATKVQKWGNSLAVRLPKETVRHLALQAGSGVTVWHDNDTIVIKRKKPENQATGKNDWKRYLIPTKHKKENVSGSIDTIVYGVPR